MDPAPALLPTISIGLKKFSGGLASLLSARVSKFRATTNDLPYRFFPHPNKKKLSRPSYLRERNDAGLLPEVELASGEEAEDAVEVARLTFEAVLIRVLQRVYCLIKKCVIVLHVGNVGFKLVKSTGIFFQRENVVATCK